MNPRFEMLILWTALLAASAYGVADENPGLLLIGIVGVLTSWLIVRARDGRALPMSATISLTLAAVGYAMLRLVGEGFKVGVFSEFVLALLVVKLSDRRSSRDNAQVLLLSIFLIVGAILTSNRLFLGLIIVVFVPVFGATVVRHQIETARQIASVSGVRPTTQASVAERLDLRRLVWFATLACLAISVGVFVLMPRGVGMQAFGAWGNTSLGQVTSFTDEVELGRGGLISQSSTPVLDLEVRDAQGRTRGSASEVFYLRGAVLNVYSDGSWRRPANDRGFLGGLVPIDAASPYPVGPNEPEIDYELRITMRNVRAGETHLFSVWTPIEIESVTPTDIKHDTNDGSIMRKGPAGKFEYIVRCRAWPSEFVRQRMPRPPPTFPSEAITRLTETILAREGSGDEEVRETPIDPDPLTRPSADTVTAVKLIRSYLVSNYAYSLETRSAPPGQDPTEWFLLGEEKRGHCEYFASAMAAMCRSVGINSRVITGYVATEWNAPTGHYIVRESNAHAWVEVEVQPDRWEQHDPTPTVDLYAIHEPSSSLGARLRRLMDTAEYAWINSVVGFNRRSRSRMVDSSIDGAVATWSQDLGERVRAGGPGLVVTAIGAGMIAFAFTMAISLLLVWLFRGPWRGAFKRLSGLAPRRGWRLSRGRSRQASELLRADLLGLFERLGRPKPGWRPLEAHAETLRTSDDDHTDAAPIARRIARAIYRERFGGVSFDRETTESVRSDLADLRRSARRTRRR